MSEGGAEDCAYVIGEILQHKHEGQDKHQLMVHYPLQRHPVHQKGNGRAAAYKQRAGGGGGGGGEGEGEGKQIGPTSGR